MIKDNLGMVKSEIEKILKESENSKIIKEGIKTIIIGRPNVGKSSLLNKLIDEEKAIVTDMPGTTRDIVEGSANIDGILLNIVDTAGIRETEDVIEKIGVNKSIKMLEEADLIILVLNNNEGVTDSDLDLIKKSNSKNKLIFINKDDLKSNIDLSLLDGENIVYGNTVDRNGLEDLKNKIKDMFNIDEIEHSDMTYLSNARQIGILYETLELIKNINASLADDIPIDLIAIDIKRIYELLGEIIGESYDEELINELFKQFCLGK
jgi:tRNA modification GTPase